MQEPDEYSEEIQNDGQAVIRKRKRQVIIRLDDAEFARFQDLQKETSLTGAALFRRWITGQRIESTVDIQAINEMRRQGGLLKINAWNLGNRKLLEPCTVERLVELGESIHAIARGMRDDYKKGSEDR